MLPRSRKAVVQQVFISIMAIFVIAFLLLFGYRSIINLLDRQCSIQEHSSMTRLQTLIEEATAYGMVQEISLTAPCDADELCIVDSCVIDSSRCEDSSTPRPITLSEQGYDLIRENANDKITYNLYFVDIVGAGKTRITPIGYSDRIDLKAVDGVVCIPAKGGVFTFGLRGEGKRGVEVYPLHCVNGVQDSGEIDTDCGKECRPC